MMKHGFCALILAVVVAGPVGAADPPPTPGAPEKPDKPSTPSTVVTAGAEIRLRAEGFNNALDLNGSLDDSYQLYRTRSRVSIDAQRGEDVHVYVRLLNEYRWGRGELVSGSSDPDSKVSIDNGWIDLKIQGVEGLGMRFGRQDLSYGEGFLIQDGTPADGSSSAYFDALKFTYKRCDRLAFDLFNAKIEDEGFGTTNGTENLYGLYGMWTPSTVRKGDFYLLYHDKRDPTKNSSGVVIHPRQNTAALGGRYALLPTTGLRYAVEAAVQTGGYAGNDRFGVGGYARGGWISSAAVHPGCELSALYLSGDKASTARYEGWDNFFSEWPKYSDLLIYAFSDTKGRIRPDDAGTWTNLEMLGVEGRLSPVTRATAQLRASWVGAPEATGPGSGKVRGVLVVGTLNVDLGSNLKGQAIGEWFDPGNYYAKDADNAIYGRLQLTAGF